MHHTDTPTTPHLAPDAAAAVPRRQVRHRCDTPLLRSLDEEWARLRRRRVAAARARGWTDPSDHGRELALRRATSGLRDLDRLMAATARADHGGITVTDGEAVDPDVLLGALVVVARRDPLAARVVLQRILPAVISAARRWDTARRGEAIDLAVGGCALAIAAYDVDARPRNVAAALVSDVVWITFRRPHRRRSSGEVPTANDTFARRAGAPPEPHPIVGLAATVAAAERAGVERRHLELVRELAATGSTDVVAQRHRVTARTIRNRRTAAGLAIRTALGDDWRDLVATVA